MNRPEQSPFLGEALRVGRRLARAAIRDDGQCTWLTDEWTRADEAWQLTAQTLGIDFATGTAGVGWFLARLASATRDAEVAEVAGEALAHALAGGDSIVAQGRLGLHDGATGVAWAAIDGGRALARPDLEAKGLELAVRAADALSTLPEPGRPASLLNGNAGDVAGLLGLADLLDNGAFLERASAAAQSLVAEVAEWTAVERATPSTRVGLLGGASGVGLVLAAWSVRADRGEDRGAAGEALRTERQWFHPKMRWQGDPVYAWADRDSVARSWSSGAAGIGLARLGAYAASPNDVFLAEAAAAIEILRHAPPSADPADASLCHGTAGEIELMISAAVALNEPAHLDAARRAGARLMAQAARRGGRYGSALGSDAHNPSLLLGLAGTGVVLLRLHDPVLASNPAMPIVESPARH